MRASILVGLCALVVLGGAPMPASAVVAITAEMNDSILVDIDQDGQLDAGETIRYFVGLVNFGNEDARGVQFTDNSPPHTTFVDFSVSRFPPAPFATSTPTLAASLDLGTVVAGELVEILLDYRLDDPFPDEIDFILNQGRVSGSNFTDVLTDDPDTAQPADPTITQVFEKTAPIPLPAALPLLGTALLGLLGLTIRR